MNRFMQLDMYLVDQLEATKSQFRSKILDQYFDSPYKALACVPHIRPICDSPQLASSASNRASEGSTANLLKDFDCHGGALHIITGARCEFLTRVVKVETGSLKRPNTKLVVTMRRNSRPLFGRREKHSVLTLRCNLYRGTGPWLQCGYAYERLLSFLFSTLAVLISVLPALAQSQKPAKPSHGLSKPGQAIFLALSGFGFWLEIFRAKPSQESAPWPEPAAFGLALASLAHGSGFKNPGPKPDQARPKPWLSGQAKPGKH
ncbi:hypothetical protein R3P38DRAFT_2801748 [Favolaschia claudopus]|uniref:Uncharacterized protein n=1 Tax=Favolaschia claudopus TaxID=2862362 RepID=A0AAV9ZVU4_9AGAR